MIPAIKRILILLLGVVIFTLPSLSLAREWSDIQKQVWQMEQVIRCPPLSTTFIFWAFSDSCWKKILYIHDFEATQKL